MALSSWQKLSGECMRPILAGLLCIGLAACGGQSGRLALVSCGLGPAISLPVEVNWQAAIVTVTINQRRARLLLDTGANVSVINRNAASVLGLTVVPDTKSVFQAVGGKASSERATVQNLTIGGVALTDLSVGVNKETIEDGVLGLDVLQQFDADIDLPHGRITLHQGGLCEGAAPPIPGNVLEIPAKRAIVHGVGVAQVTEPYLMVPVSLKWIGRSANKLQLLYCEF